MGYFPVRYDSRVVNYNPRGFIRLAIGEGCESSGASRSLISLTIGKIC